MVIDDDEPTNFLSNMIIEEAACTRHIQIEDSVAKAISYLRNSAKPGCGNNDQPVPDLIFLDINMPAMNGWEFLEKFERLKNKLKKNIELYVMTSSVRESDKERSTRYACVSSFISKPLSKQMLNSICSQGFA